ncbi:MAG: DUF4271 domain-containing protein [Raineya sp.]|jgi:hypothetical protein|nr:DUF4271 domain-containing protein [Raineya sp.]
MIFSRKFKLPAFLFIFFLLTGVKSLANNKVEKIIVDLKDYWLYYDATYNSYISYISNNHQQDKLIHFWLKPKQFRQYKLILEFKEDTYLYINHKIQQKYKQGVQSISLDSLSQIYSQESLFITLYGSVESCLIGIPSYQTKKMDEVPELINKNNIQQYRKHITFYILIILIIYTLVKQYDTKMLVEYLQLNKFFQVQRRQDNPLFIRVFQNNNLLFLCTYAILTGTFFHLLDATNQGSSLLIFQKYNNQNLNLSWANWGIWVGLLMLWTFAKYIIIWASANLLSVSKLINLHFYEYIRISHFFYLILTLGLLLLGLHLPHQISSWYNIFKTILVFAYVVRTIILWYNTNSFSEFRKLDFFSYLCVSEIIPLMIYIKMLFFI